MLPTAPAQPQSNAPAVSAASHSSGSLTEFDAPGAATVDSPACDFGTGASFCGTLAYGINDEGTIIGYYTDVNVVAHGYVRTPGGSITSFDPPGAGTTPGLFLGTVAYTINDRGVSAGNVQGNDGVYHAWLRDRSGNFTEFDAPGAGTGFGQGSVAYETNVVGVTAGNFTDASGTTHGFVRSRDGAIASFDPPASISTISQGINTEGAITAFYATADGNYHAFLRAPSGSITTIAPSDASGSYTVAAAINDLGVVTGYYVNSTGGVRAYARIPDGNYVTVNVPN
ncbi:MAG: hypothetical protein JO293_07390, partial [Candidatus Eremiobacteraeota bacterium]|nr:hypothetical protein [Candidatus Eremiobacteraeota bacterium]